MSAAAVIAEALDKGFRTSGTGFSAKCPVHDDGNASLKITDGDKGVLVYCHAGCDSRDVIDEIKARGLWPENKERGTTARKPRSTPKPKAAPAPANDEFGPVEKRPKVTLKEVAKYDYFDPQTGELKMQVIKFEPKTFLQRRPDPDKPGEWINGVGPEHRTLYNAARVSRYDRIVFIVEGEKDVDNLAALDLVGTCNPGGAGKWQDNYSEILRGKDVVLVPDNDPQSINKATGELRWHPDGRPVHPGQDHMDLVGKRLQGIAKRVRILHLPDLPVNGDISDWLAVEGNDRAALGALVKAAPIWEPPVAPQREPEPQAELEPWEPGQSAPATTTDFGGQFTPLGYNKGTFYYIGGEGEQIVELSGSGHTKGNLLMLAPLWFWNNNFAATKGGFDVDAAADAMMRACYAKGIFSAELMRGRGAWWDDGRIILHCGDRVYVDGRPMAPAHVPSRFVYERGRPMPADVDNPLDLGGARRFLDLVKMMAWARPIDALYVAGWCALAPVCGVLSWRPHIWVVGAKGSGKSHVMSSVIKPLLGEDGVSCLFAVGNTSEAGLRQRLGCDALPVLFDEAEGEGHRSHDRLQRILELVRQSSSETGAKLIKGSAAGHATSYQIRSCFAFSSINASLVQQSDRSRVTLVELRKENQRLPFEHILAAEADLFRGVFVQRFHARAIAQAATIRENAKVFSKVVAAVMGEQRAGDQFGTLLAGAYSLQCDGLATYEDAAKWVAAHNLDEDRDEVGDMSDERKCLDRILESKLDITLSDRRETRTVAEWIGMGSENPVLLALQREGIHVLAAGNDNGRSAEIVILNTMEGVRKFLHGSPWEHAEYNKVMKRLPGAEPLKDPISIAALRTNKRGLRINLGVARR